MEAAGANWIAVCYKSIREDVKWCTANGFIVVGDRKWWSTLSDSPTTGLRLIWEEKFIRRSCGFTTHPTYCRRKTMVTSYCRLYHVIRQSSGRTQLRVHILRESIRQLTVTGRWWNPDHSNASMPGAHRERTDKRYCWCALEQHTNWICLNVADAAQRAPLLCLCWKHSQQHKSTTVSMPMNKISNRMDNGPRSVSWFIAATLMSWIKPVDAVWWL